MDTTKVIYGAVSILIGLILLPVIAGFHYGVTHDYITSKHGGNWTADANVTGVSGLSSLVDLVLYGFTFGLVGLGIGLIYLGFKKK